MRRLGLFLLAVLYVVVGSNVLIVPPVSIGSGGIIPAPTGGLAPTIALNVNHGYAGQTVTVTGSGVNPYPAVRVAWLLDGATQTAAIVTADRQCLHRHPHRAGRSHTGSRQNLRHSHRHRASRIRVRAVHDRCAAARQCLRPDTADLDVAIGPAAASPERFLRTVRQRRNRSDPRTHPARWLLHDQQCSARRLSDGRRRRRAGAGRDSAAGGLPRPASRWRPSSCPAAKRRALLRSARTRPARPRFTP